MGCGATASRKYCAEEINDGEYPSLSSAKPSPAIRKSTTKQSMVPQQTAESNGGNPQHIAKGLPGPPLPLLPAQLGDESKVVPPLRVQKRSELAGRSKQSGKGTSQASSPQKANGPRGPGTGKISAETPQKATVKSPTSQSKGSRDAKPKLGSVNFECTKRASREVRGPIVEMITSEDQMPLPEELQEEDDGKDAGREPRPVCIPPRPVRTPLQSYRCASHLNQSAMSTDEDSDRQQSGVIGKGGGCNDGDKQLLKFERCSVQLNAVNLKRNSKLQLVPVRPPPPLPPLPVDGLPEPDNKDKPVPSRSEKKDFSELSMAFAYIDLS